MKMCLKQATSIHWTTCDAALTDRSNKRIKEVLCTTPEVHLVRQLGAKDWNVGDWTGKRDRKRTIQSARIESNILNT